MQRQAVPSAAPCVPNRMGFDLQLGDSTGASALRRSVGPCVVECRFPPPGWVRTSEGEMGSSQTMRHVCHSRSWGPHIAHFAFSSSPSGKNEYSGGILLEVSKCQYWRSVFFLSLQFSISCLETNVFRKHTVNTTMRIK